MRKDGTFIGIEVDDSKVNDVELVAKLNEVCPVDIFHVAENKTLTLNEENLDECVLCELCIQATSDQVVSIHKLYS